MFYDLDKNQRKKIVEQISNDIANDLQYNRKGFIKKYFSDGDTYIRKGAYLAIGKIYKANRELFPKILQQLNNLFSEKDERIRQTVVNAAGEIGILDFNVIESFLDQGLLDGHHSVRNAVIGSLKKMSEKNPVPVLAFAKRYLHHPDKEIRREICHGIELRGRTHPQDILPLLQALQHDKTSRVKNTLVHVIGQISYKKGCLETVIKNLKSWENKEVVEKAIAEIIDVHERYKSFAVLTQKEAMLYIKNNIWFDIKKT